MVACETFVGPRNIGLCLAMWRRRINHSSPDRDVPIGHFVTAVTPARPIECHYQRDREGKGYRRHISPAGPIRFQIGRKDTMSKISETTRNASAIRDLTDTELETVSGGACVSVGPVTVCLSLGGGGDGPTWGDIYNAWAERGRDLAAGKTKF